jgi:hypothetical protein
MNYRLLVFGFVAWAMTLSGCATSRVSALPTIAKPVAPVRTIALAPTGGILAEAIGVELSNRGFVVIDSATTSKLMIRLNLNEVEIAKPEGLTKLKGEGIDAYMSVSAAGGYDQLPQSASVRMNSTHNGQILAGVTWQQGWGGQAGSIADRVMRKGLSEVAAEITDALVKNLQ